MLNASDVWIQYSQSKYLIILSFSLHHVGDGADQRNEDLVSGKRLPFNLSLSLVGFCTLLLFPFWVLATPPAVVNVSEESLVGRALLMASAFLEIRRYHWRPRCEPGVIGLVAQWEPFVFLHWVSISSTGHQGFRPSHQAGGLAGPFGRARLRSAVTPLRPSNTRPYDPNCSTFIESLLVPCYNNIAFLWGWLAEHWNRWNSGRSLWPVFPWSPLLFWRQSIATVVNTAFSQCRSGATLPPLMTDEGVVRLWPPEASTASGIWPCVVIMEVNSLPVEANCARLPLHPRRNLAEVDDPYLWSV